MSTVLLAGMVWLPPALLPSSPPVLVPVSRVRALPLILVLRSASVLASHAACLAPPPLLLSSRSVHLRREDSREGGEGGRERGHVQAA